MKTFIVNSTKTIVRKTAVEAKSAAEAERLVKSGLGESVDLSRRVSNTVNGVSEYRSK